MKLSLKLLITGLSTLLMGMIGAVITAYTEEPDGFFPPTFGIFVYSIYVLVCIVPAQLVLNALLHAVRLINLGAIPLSSMIIQSAVFIMSVFLILYVDSVLPDDVIWIKGTEIRHWYFQIQWLFIYSLIPLTVYTIVSGRIYLRRQTSELM